MISGEKPVTSQEKLLSALAHCTILLLGSGTAIPLIIWNQQREKSRFAASQAMQAVWWQSLFPLYLQVVLLVELLIFILMAAITGFEAGVTGTPAREMPAAAFTWMAAGLGVAALLYILIGLVAAVLCLFGLDFAYPFMGRRIARLLSSDPQNAAENLTAAAAHAGMFVPMFGMLPALIAWVMVKPASERLRFHGKQALIFQGAAMLVNIVLSAILFLLSIPLALLAVMLYNAVNPSNLLIIAMIALVIIVFILSTLAVLALPLFGVFACIAIVKTLRGKEYSYPIIGKMLQSKPEVAAVSRQP